MHNMIIGETCLLAYQLRRLNIIQDENELFDNMITTLDGVHKLIEDDFQHILNVQYLKHLNYAYYPDHGISYSKWVNTRYSIDTNNIFSWPVFSFFHYDAFNIEQKDSIKRKTQRFEEKFMSKENVNLFYYYREGKNFNIEKIIEKCSSLLLFLITKYNKQFKLFLITKTHDIKGVKFKDYGSIQHLNFTSPSSWIGTDDNWNGSSDNDLFDNFLEHYNTLF